MTDIGVLVRQLQGRFMDLPVAVTGTVADTGAAARGSGYASAKVATGRYTVTFDEAMSVVPVTVVSMVGATGRVITYDEFSTGFSVATYDHAGADADRTFSFRAEAW